MPKMEDVRLCFALVELGLFTSHDKSWFTGKEMIWTLRNCHIVAIIPRTVGAGAASRKELKARPHGGPQPEHAHLNTTSWLIKPDGTIESLRLLKFLFVELME